MSKEKPGVITIDGPGGSGKGTIAAELARRLGWHLLDSGALYRLVALAAIRRGISADDGESLSRIARELDAEFGNDRDGPVLRLDRQDVGDAIRSERVGTFASRVAALPAVREALKERQRAFRRLPGLVADGRDMGTVIFPDADLKIFLTASAGERAARRYKQLKDKGESVNLSRLLRDIESRDERDRNRAVAPLQPAADAHVVDSTDLTIEEVLGMVEKLVKKQNITS